MDSSRLYNSNGDPSGKELFSVGLKWGLGVLAFVAIFGTLFWGMGTGWAFATQKVNMHKEAYVQTFNGANKLGSDKAFVDLYNGIVANGQQVKIHKNALDNFKKDNPNYSSNIMLSQQYGQLTSNLSGTEQILQSSIAEYNAKADSLLSQHFLPVGYPAKLSPTNPPTEVINR